MFQIHASILLLPLDLFQIYIREVQTITFTVFKVLIENSVLAAATRSINKHWRKSNPSWISAFKLQSRIDIKNQYVEFELLSLSSVGTLPLKGNCRVPSPSKPSPFFYISAFTDTSSEHQLTPADRHRSEQQIAALKS